MTTGANYYLWFLLFVMLWGGLAVCLSIAMKKKK